LLTAIMSRIANPTYFRPIFLKRYHSLKWYNFWGELAFDLNFTLWR